MFCFDLNDDGIQPFRMILRRLSLTYKNQHATDLISSQMNTYIRDACHVVFHNDRLLAKTILLLNAPDDEN